MRNVTPALSVTSDLLGASTDSPASLSSPIVRRASSFSTIRFLAVADHEWGMEHSTSEHRFGGWVPSARELAEIRTDDESIRAEINSFGEVLDSLLGPSARGPSGTQTSTGVGTNVMSGTSPFYWPTYDTPSTLSQSLQTSQSQTSLAAPTVVEGVAEADAASSQAMAGLPRRGLFHRGENIVETGIAEQSRGLHLADHDDIPLLKAALLSVQRDKLALERRLAVSEQAASDAREEAGCLRAEHASLEVEAEFERQAWRRRWDHCEASADAVQDELRRCRDDLQNCRQQEIASSTVARAELGELRRQVSDLEKHRVAVQGELAADGSTAATNHSVGGRATSRYGRDLVHFNGRDCGRRARTVDVLIDTSSHSRRGRSSRAEAVVVNCQGPAQAPGGVEKAVLALCRRLEEDAAALPVFEGGERGGGSPFERNLPPPHDAFVSWGPRGAALATTLPAQLAFP
eukprot:TRINITY_DN36677_c0_g2_i1.p2 TRINITY_DN36677_c0_g2~~TRINITY_DN36677_c0_g2_i1.p2  ORF type:complete len:461 (-),score=73.42 TRINITY_DN36677_c0_g2_i1:231-1613(-)